MAMTVEIPRQLAETDCADDIGRRKPKADNQDLYVRQRAPAH
jgi:hypothetical protein